MQRRDLIVGIAGVLARPCATWAEQVDHRRRVGVLMSTAESDRREQAAVAAFTEALEKRGWTAGHNLEISWRWGAGDPARMKANAQELLAFRPDAILVKGANLPAIYSLTSAIPIVFVLLSDAVAKEYVTSFARPSGNVTGFSSDERALVGKRLELLRTISPEISRVLYVRSRRVGTDTQALYERATGDGKALGLSILDGAALSARDIESAVSSFARKSNGGLVIAFDAFTSVHRGEIVALAARYRLPAVYPLDFFVEGGGLLSYGLDQDDQFRQAASYIDRILRGAKPGELPVQFPTRVRLVVNFKTAKALGLTIPQSIVLRADQVIE